MMRRTLFLPLVVMASLSFGHDHVLPHDARAGLQFHENKGQWPAQVLYRARTDGGAVFVERDALTYVITAGGAHLAHGRTDVAVEPLRMHAYTVHFEGARTGRHEGLGRMAHYVNYFLGDDPSKWGTGAGAFGGVELHEVYPGIGMHLDGSKGLKYDWLVAAGADPGMIQMRYEGQDDLRVEGGLLFIGTSAGRVVEQRPVAWQVVHGARRPVAARYVLEGDRVSFAFPNGIDDRYPLVIDPIVTFSSFSGSVADNYGCTATYDASGHLYGGGSAFGIGYPTTPGVVVPGFAGGTIDMGISKFSPDGSSLVWSTYIGGIANDLPHSMVVNSADELYILGTTNSNDFPVSAGCYDNTFGGGAIPPFGGSYGFTYATGCDVAVVHLNSTATSIIGATYVGGTGNDGLNQYTPLLRNYGDPFRGEIIMDLQERPIIATSTTSSGLFTSPGAPQPAHAGGLDAYIFRLDPALTTMLWATYYGGTGNDAGFGVQVSSIGEIFMTGGTQSTDLLMAGTPAAPAFAGGVDGFIARFAEDGSALLSSTYLGTSGFDQSYFVQLDTQDDVFVVGQTTGNYPVTPGKYAEPTASQFLHKFSNDLSTSLWSTRIAGTANSNISPSAFLVSICGQIYFSGWGGSTNPAGGGLSTSSTAGLTVTSDAFQSNTDGSDFYLMVLDQEAVSLAYATFFGGTADEHVDGGTSRFDKDGKVYQAVCAACGSGSFPTTPGVYGPNALNDNCNLGVFKIDFEQGVNADIEVSASDQQACLGLPVIFDAQGNATFWTWDLGDGSGQQEGVQVEHTYASAGSYEVMLIGTDSTSCNVSDTAFVTVQIVPPLDMQPDFQAEPSSDCQGFSVELFNMSTGSGTFYWQFGDGVTSAATNPVHPYAGPGTYDVVLGVIDPLCMDTAFLAQTIVLDPPSIELDLPSPVALCDGASVVLDAGAGYDSYAWSTGSGNATLDVTAPGTYWVDVVDGICQGSDTVVVVERPGHPPAPDVTSCPGDAPLLSPPFLVTSILWNTGDTARTILASSSGTYAFVAVDEYGCLVSDTIEVTLITTDSGLAFVPNVFSPNGDQQNDTFQVTGLALTRFNMNIYNRWGQEVFSATNPSTGWNGGLDNSADKVPDGTYYYVISFTDLCSSEPTTTHKGHVTLLR
ncbi:MAG: gliding motility-associated C-terminal domain-containing protein [Flavobacteriales bacterium]